MKKVNLYTLLFTILMMLLLADFVFADDTWNGTDKTGDTWRSGKVGIGTATPTAMLDVAGDIKTINGASGYYGIGSVHPGIDDADADRPNLGTSNKVERINYHTGLSFSAHSYYGGIRFYNQGYSSTENNPYLLSGAPVMTITDGNVGIGATSPSTKLHIDAPMSDLDETVLKVSHRSATQKSGARIELGSGYSLSATSRIIGYSNPHITNASQLEFQTMDPDGQTWHSLYMDENGNIGIATTIPQSKLAVNGTITTREVKVTDSGWSDFVFEKDYNLQNLNQVETYIKENKHLPDIPSAKQVEEEGLSMADMMKKQMQKIEELTLYVIEQNKQLSALKKENEEMKQQLEKLVN